ncbi:LysR family transcriptional regulator [Bradyrhizobium prioriisuperbiae]|uniref:LysR family transcriptional regulator n=1 Tax=Bradyrhizobium prioriisuperbiae TaxID=2854389 RepID=UPI0028E1DE7A|nr:LysR family transcriptional regulator [Bradyrhizobium prioritasuperba]
MEPNWSHYRSFLAVMREGSLSGAARVLGMTQPTLGRQIAELEQDLGTALFIRSQRGLLPTDAAKDIAPHAEAMAAASGAMVRSASGGTGDVAGVIRLTASEIVGAEVLPSLLASFRRAHPAVAIELSLSNRVEDLLKGAADIAVRMVRPGQQALVARQLGSVGLGLYAHKRYLGSKAPPATLDTLLNDHALIGFDQETPFLRALQSRLPITRARLALRTDSDLAQLAAIRAGFGIGFIQHGIARRDPELIAVLPEDISFTLEVWLALHEDLRASRRLRLMMDHLTAGLAEYVAGSQAGGTARRRAGAKPGKP